MRMHRVIHSIKTAGLSSSFQADMNNFMLAETMLEYALYSAEAAYENPGEHAPMGFMALGGEIQGSENISPRMDRKMSPLLSPTGTNNTRRDTAAI